MRTRSAASRSFNPPVKSIPPKQAAYPLDIFRSVELIQSYVAEFPNIPFHKIVGMRNRVVHDYGQVDFEIVWETVQTHLPLLFKELGGFFSEREDA